MDIIKNVTVFSDIRKLSHVNAGDNRSRFMFDQRWYVWIDDKKEAG